MLNNQNLITRMLMLSCEPFYRAYSVNLLHISLVLMHYLHNSTAF